MNPRSSLPIAFALLLSTAFSSTHAQTPEPELLDTWGSMGTGSGQWVDPLRMTSTGRGELQNEDLFVVDRTTGRVQRHSSDGLLLAEWGSSTTLLSDPVAVAWRPAEGFPPAPEEVLVLDAGLDAVVFFDLQGNYLRQFAVTPFADGDIDLDPSEERVYVLLSDRHVLERYTLSGTMDQLVGTLDLPGSSPGQFDTPHGLAVLWEAGRIAVADTGNDRIVVHSAFFGSPEVLGGAGGPFFDAPLGLDFDCRGDLIIADTGNDRLQRWQGVSTGNSTFDASWFEPPSGGLLRVVDVALPLLEGVIVGKEGEAGRRKAIGGDLFVLDAEAGQMRRYEGTCCSGGFFFCDRCTATTAGGGLMITPAGNGPTLESVGATIEIFLLDDCGLAVAGYPFQDIWLDDIGDGSIALCQGGSAADANTNAQGRTTISGAISGGGFTDQGMQVYFAGLALSQPPLDIRVTSPDINGDLSVDLADIGEFALDYFALEPTFRSDFNFDGVIDLGDIGAFAPHLQEACP